jgi:ankyrin repeat protein
VTEIKAESVPLFCKRVFFLVRMSSSKSTKSKSTDALALHRAARSGDAELVQQLVRSDACDVNAQPSDDASGGTALHAAAAANARDACRALIALGADAALRDRPGATALHVAAAHAHADVVVVLLAARADTVRSTAAHLRTPLHLAVCGGEQQNEQQEANAVLCCRLLVKGGADVDARDEHGNSPLLLAAAAGNAALCKALVSLDASLTLANDAGGTALHVAARHGHDGVVQLLLRECADLAVAIAAKDQLGQSPLHSAAIGGSSICAELLLASGASAALGDARGLTPLHECTSRQVASVLLKAGAKVGAKTLQGRTPLHIAALENRARIVKYLVEKRADVDARDGDGATPLHCAAFRGHLDSIAALLDADASADATDHAKLTPLHVAAFRGHTDVVKKLLGAVDDVNKADDSGTTALHGAAAAGHEKVVKTLLTKGQAAPNCCTKEGGTPLHFAAAANHGKVVALLLAHEAHVDATDQRSRTALQFAAHQGHADVCARLLKAGANVASTDADGNNSLHVACLSSSHDALATLLKNAPSDALQHALKARNSRIMTPLELAKEAEANECVKLLATSGQNDDDDDDADGDDDKKSKQVVEKVAPAVTKSRPAPPSSSPTATKRKSATLKNEKAAKLSSDKTAKPSAKTDDDAVNAKPTTSAPTPPAAAAASKSKKPAAPAPAAAPAAAAATDDSNLALLTGCIQGAKLVPLHRLGKLVLEPERKLVKVLFKTTQLADADKLARGLIYLHERSGDTQALLRCAIDYELANSETAGTVFRANSLQSKLLTQYASLHGNEYLRDVLLKPLDAVLKRKEALEIDPTRIELSEKLAKSADTKAQEAERRRVVQENTTVLVVTIRSFVDALFGSAERVPESIRFVCAELSSRVRAKFGDEQVPIIVGGFFFLRFVTPSVVSPEGPGQLVPATRVTKEARRTLLLLSKVLTQLANGVPKFGVREEFMAPLNNTLGSELENMRAFLGRISSTSRRVEAAQITDAKVVEGWNLLHERLAYDRERIDKALDADTNRSLGTVLSVLTKPPALTEEDRKK